MIARLTIGALVALVLVAFAYGESMIWRECRDAGHSAFYCFRMLAR